MTAYRVQLESRARKHLASTDPVIRRRLVAAIDALSANPEPPGCTPLKGMQGILRIRVGDYRIVYGIAHGEHLLTVFDIDHRKDIYR